jgi:hypothetical protein
MELIERYLYAVGRWLPKKQKKDIQAELESTIYDNLESRFGSKEEYTEDEITEIIREFGSPWKVAAGYTGLTERLIGPELLPIYFTLSVIISGAVVLGLLVSFIVGMFRPDMTFGTFILSFLELIPSLIVAVATVVGFTTIVFALIEKCVPGYKLKSVSTLKRKEKGFVIDNDKWSPKDLPPVPMGKQKISRWEPILGIIFSVIAIVLFNFFREKLGIYYTPEWGSGWEFVPILSEDAVKVFLPFWNTVWGLSIVFCTYQLIKGRWTLPMRIADLLRSLVDAAVIIIMIRGPELFDFRLLLSYSKPDVVQALKPVAEFFNYSINAFLIFALVGTCIGIIAKLVNVFRPSTYSAIPEKTSE